jgi:hypothetical protein
MAQWIEGEVSRTSEGPIRREDVLEVLPFALGNARISYAGRQRVFANDTVND